MSSSDDYLSDFTLSESSSSSSSSPLDSFLIYDSIIMLFLNANVSFLFYTLESIDIPWLLEILPRDILPKLFFPMLFFLIWSPDELLVFSAKEFILFTNLSSSLPFKSLMMITLSNGLLSPLKGRTFLPLGGFGTGVSFSG